MQVRLNPTIVASDASGAVSIARSLEREANSLAGRLSGTSGMAGIDPMAEEFALGSKARLAGYRLRAFDEASRIRSISGSRAVAHRANPYNPPAISSPARNE